VASNGRLTSRSLARKGSRVGKSESADDMKMEWNIESTWQHEFGFRPADILWNARYDSSPFPLPEDLSIY
jgi:hypothetical protein